MRVYGSSPLYNYVELVFRSKRLFIVSVVLTSLIVASVAAMKAGTYTASAIIVLSNSSSAAQGSDDAAQRGSVKYKLNVLNVITKDPNFFKDAFRLAGFDKVGDTKLTDEQFDEFCQNARKALRFGTGENVLEITCQWKDRQAEDIVKAFYDAYSRRVLELETVMSTQTTKTLVAMQDTYTKKVAELEQKLINYQTGNVGKDMLTAASTANAIYQQKVETVKALQTQLNLARASLGEVERQLANTPNTIKDFEDIERENIEKSPAYVELINRRGLVEQQLEEELKKHTETHPNVKALQGLLAQYDTRLNQMKGSVKSKDPGRGVRTRLSTNPTWHAWNAKRSDVELAIQQLEMNLTSAIQERDEAYNKAKTTPLEIQKFRKMTERLPLYQSIKENLGAKLEQAKIDEERDREMHITEMKMMVDPVAEPDTGGKSLLFFAAGPILGLIIAFAFSLLVETLDHSLRTPVEVEKYLGKPVLAVLPRMDTPKESPKRLASSGEQGPPILPSS